MNSIASFLPSLQARPSLDPQESRNDSEDGINSGKGTGNKFDTVLSGLSKNVPSNAGTPPPRPSLTPLPGAATGANGTTEPPATVPSSAVAATVAQLSAQSAAAAAANAQTARASGLATGLPTPPLPSATAGAPNLLQQSGSTTASQAATSDLLDAGGQAASAVFGKGRGASASVGSNQSLAPSATAATASVPAASVESSPVAAPPAMPTQIAIPAQIAMVATQAAMPSVSKGPGVDAATGKRTASNSAGTARQNSVKPGDVPAHVLSVDPTALAAVAAMVAPNRSVVAAPTSTPAAPAKNSTAGRSIAQVDESGTSQTPSALQLQAQEETQAVVAAPGLNGNPTAADSAPQSTVTAADLSSTADPAAVKVAVLSSATYFAPVARLSPVQQIADAVIGALPTLFPGGPAPAANDVANAGSVVSTSNPTVAVAQPAATAVKTMNLQMEPGSLGVVTVTLSLSANGLDVQMATSQTATMNIIEKGRQSLADQLGQSGYSVAGLAVTLGAHGGANVGDNGSATQGQGGQGPASGGGQAMSQGGSSNGNSSPQNSGQNAPNRGDARQNLSNPSPNGAAGSVSLGSIPDDLYI